MYHWVQKATEMALWPALLKRFIGRFKAQVPVVVIVVSTRKKYVIKLMHLSNIASFFLNSVLNESNKNLRFRQVSKKLLSQMFTIAE